MKREILLGIDIGTQSTRAAFLTPDGEVVASVGRPQEMETPHAVWAEQDPHMWWVNAVHCINEAMQTAAVLPEEVLAIGVGGQMHGTVPPGPDGELLSHDVQLWCDKRGAAMVDAFKLLPDAEASYRLAGSPPVVNWVGFKIAWLKENIPEIYSRTSKFVMPIDYVNFRLCGVTSTDYSEASGFFLSEGLIFFPYLLGERTLGTPYARAVFFGLTPRHDVASMVRAIMEGVTFELRQTLDIVEQAGHPVRIIYHSGGGTYSDLWSQIKADIYKKPVVTFENSEGGLLGAAILAGSGAGVYPNEVEGARRCLRPKHKFEPDPALAERYDGQFTLFQELHDLLQVPFTRLADLHP